MSDHESYRRWRLPELWQMLAADNATDAHLHVTTLRRQQTALEAQRDRLRTLRDQLAQAWPPEKSEAATAFIQRINDMIRAMSLTASGAAEVRSRVSLIVEALDQARTELAPLIEQYQRTADLPDQRVGKQARKLLDERARRILMTADAAVVDPAAALNVQLPAYERFSMQTTVAAPVGGGDPTGGNSGGSSGRRGLVPVPRFDPPEPAAQSPNAEFGLAAGDLDTARPVPSIGLAMDPAGSIGGAADRSVLGPGRILVPGGVAPPGSAGANVAVDMRGVIGGGGSGARPAISTPGVGATAARGTGGATGYRDRSFGVHANRRRAAREGSDEPWSVQQGVRPLIDVPPVRADDPGPGVIGIDR
ncbi:hypothetical protein ACFO1B_36590 [Dactylosporangium siamense]|uniref:Uncharacterized protein n=1 Tax=Dactylosporangium siamense TaxID=685454 RepID=A0A919PS99_9ACTN|nr:hypothetical protein [Dactylosporangium siamense]GIG49282.1 hypothetical protein Dsi01nite_073230 [Dactylosporangium siamense]